LASRLRRLTTGIHQPGQASGGAVMPGFAIAKPGTGQTAPAIIAPASCRHGVIPTFVQPGIIWRSKNGRF